MYYLLYVYWAMLALAAIGIGVLTCKAPTVASVIGRFLGKFWKYNNWRWGTCVVVGVLLAINAFLAGRGEPIFSTSAKEVGKAVVNEVKKHPGAIHEVERFLWGTNLSNALPVPAASTAPAAVNRDKKYHSWWHLIVAVVWWLWVIAYFFISRRDEIAKALRRSKRSRQITNNPPVGITTPAGSATTDGVKGWITRVFRDKGFTFHSFIEVFWEAIVPKILGKWWGRN